MKKNVLLIDDDVDFTAVNMEVLQKAGYNVSVAHNGEEGMKAIKASKPDLLVLDEIGRAHV